MPASTVQPTLFDLDQNDRLIAAPYTEADRVADRELCKDYLHQWSSSFKKSGAQPTIGLAEFEAAGLRLEQHAGRTLPLAA